MTILLIIALLSAFSFRKAAKSKGYSSKKFWLIPLAITGVIMLFAVAATTIGAIIMETETAKGIQSFVVTLLAVSVQCAAIAKFWKQIKQLPDRSSAK